MPFLLVVDEPAEWPLMAAGVEIVAAREYLTGPRFHRLRGARVFNLCQDYRYQTAGYYVSLLAEARGHRPMPRLGTLLDMKTPSMVRLAAEGLEEQIQRSLAPIQGEEFVLSIYFGRNLAERHGRLAWRLYNLFQAPLVRAWFARNAEGWQLRRIKPISAGDIPDHHWDFVLESAARYFGRRRFQAATPEQPAFHLAILHDPEEKEPPSDEAALRRFVRAAERQGLGVEMIRKEDIGRLAEFDALFIRETTYANHHTYRFARRAEAEGLVVVDDPESILRCTNKVYLAELMTRHRIPIPRTVLVHKGNQDRILEELELPVVLKEPDSSFSHGVVRAGTEEDLAEEVRRILARSDLLVAQEFLPTEFDWRVGVLDREPLYACRYHMARRHWQIIDHGKAGGKKRYGKVETLAVEDAPPRVVETALRAANAVGSGFYGVDLKEAGRRVVVIEVNDNPSIDAGYEDSLLKDRLYDKVMEFFLRRLRKRKQA